MALSIAVVCFLASDISRLQLFHLKFRADLTVRKDALHLLELAMPLGPPRAPARPASNR
jgi:hypothetical protein